MEIKDLWFLLFCWLYACRVIIESSWPERKGQEVVDDVLASIGRRLSLYTNLVSSSEMTLFQDGDAL